MKSLKDHMKSRVHQRVIGIRTFTTADEHVIVEGRLTDNRLVNTYYLSGENRPPDTIHDLIVRILVDDRLVIRQVETEMPQIPHPDCQETINSLQEIVGFKIRRGFTQKVKALFGKGEGCSHLTELITAMAPAAIQGFWTACSRNPLPENIIDALKLMLVDTCRVWRRGGKALKRLGE